MFKLGGAFLVGTVEFSSTTTWGWSFSVSTETAWDGMSYWYMFVEAYVLISVAMLFVGAIGCWFSYPYLRLVIKFQLRLIYSNLKSSCNIISSQVLLCSCFICPANFNHERHQWHICMFNYLQNCVGVGIVFDTFYLLT